jgi:hypothetical protein
VTQKLERLPLKVVVIQAVKPGTGDEVGNPFGVRRLAPHQCEAGNGVISIAEGWLLDERVAVETEAAARGLPPAEA